MVEQEFCVTVPQKYKILIIAGEASGDLHGSHLVRHLRSMMPDASFFGIGGDAMAREGVSLGIHASQLAVVGVTEIVGKFRVIHRAYSYVKHGLTHDPPDLVILIDFPDFNLRIARHAWRRGIPVVYYISPQVWAWRRGRIKDIARYVSKMLVIFPFEEALYREHGVDVSYVGHPLLDAVTVMQPSQTLYGEWGLSPIYPVVGLFPGSRYTEVDSVLPAMLEAAVRIRERFPRTQFLVGQAPSLDPRRFDHYLEGQLLPICKVHDHIYSAMRMCDIAIVASGTATLELALLEVPMVIVYRVSRLTYAVGRTLVRVPSIGLANLVSGKRVVPELIQGHVTGERIYESCIPFFTNAIYMSTIRSELKRIRTVLGAPGASRRAAEIICSMR